MKLKHAFHTPWHLQCPMSMYLLYIWLRISFKLLNLQKLVLCPTYIYSKYIWHFKWSFWGIKTWTYTMELQNSKKKQWKMNQSTFISVRSCHLQQWILGKKLNLSKEAIFENSWLIQGDNQDLCRKLMLLQVWNLLDIKFVHFEFLIYFCFLNVSLSSSEIMLSAHNIWVKCGQLEVIIILKSSVLSFCLSLHCRKYQHDLDILFFSL